MDPLVRNNVTLAGRPDAEKTLIFVNGLGTDQSCWNGVAPAFADEFRLLRFDNTGSIEANQASFRSRQSRYLNVAGYASDLLEICAALDLQKNLILVGHSMGALAGMLASIRRPELFERLVLLGASPRYADDEGYRGGFSAGDIEASYSALARDYVEWSRTLARAAMAHPERPSLAERFAESIVRTPPDMMLTILCSVLQADHRADLSRVGVPTLVVQSAADFFVPRNLAEYLQAHIPDCRLALIDAEGHLPHVSDPEKVLAVISDFIRKG